MPKLSSPLLQSITAAFKGRGAFKSRGTAQNAALAASRPALSRRFAAPLFGEPHSASAPFRYDRDVISAFADNPVAQRAVRLVAEGIASAPLSCSHADALALVLADSAGQSLLETLAAHLLLHGNGYVQILTDAAGRPVELYALRPERVRLVADARGWPIAFDVGDADAQVRLPALDDHGRCAVIHIRSFHPADDHYGMSCLSAAREAVAIHNAAARWNRALLENGARPSGAVIYDPGEAGATLSADQFARLQAELASAFQGAANAGRPMILEGGLKWQGMSLSPADMDFAGLKAAAARDIALAFGVPPMLLGLPGDAAYANYREANRALWRQMLLPYATKILGALVQGMRDFWPGLTLTIDQDRLPALSEDRERLWSQVSNADFLSDAEKRDLLGLKPAEKE